MIYLAGFVVVSEGENHPYRNKEEFLNGFFYGICEILFCCPDITQIILVCGYAVQLTTEDLSKFIKSKRYEKYDWMDPYKIPYSEEFLEKLPTLILNTKIFTPEDLFIKTTEDNPDDLKSLDTSILLNFIKGETVVTLSIFLSELFLHFVKDIEHLVIYKKAFVDPKFPFPIEKVDDPGLYQVFISWLCKFEYDCIPDNSDFETFGIADVIIDCFDSPEEIIPRSLEVFYQKTLRVDYGETKKINLVGTGEYLIEHFVADLNDKYGPFQICEGDGGNITIDYNEKGLVVFNADELEALEFNKINSDISSSKSKEKFYILVSTIPLKHLRDPSFKKIKIPSYDHIQSELDHLIAYMINKTFELHETEAIQKMFNCPLIRNTFYDIPSLEKVHEELDDLKFGNYFKEIDFGHRDFWWDYYRYIRSKYPGKNDEILTNEGYITQTPSTLSKEKINIVPVDISTLESKKVEITNKLGGEEGKQGSKTISSQNNGEVSDIIEFDPNYSTQNEQHDAAIGKVNIIIQNYYQSKFSTIPTKVRDLVEKNILGPFEDRQIRKEKIKYNGMSKKAFLKYIFPGLKYENRKFENFYNLFTK